MKQIHTLSSLIVLFFMFQNFTLFDQTLNSKYKIDDKARRINALELLGPQFKKSPAASEQTDSAFFNSEVHKIVKNNLSKKNKHQANEITKAILEESKKYSIDPIFIASIIKTESAFNHLAKGTSGEIGLMQLMPKTADFIAQKIKMKNYNGTQTLKDPTLNIKLGVAYINYLRLKFDNVAYKYVPAYNMGPGNLAKSIAKQKRPKDYPTKIIQFYEKFYQQIHYAKIAQQASLVAKQIDFKNEIPFAF